MRSNQCIRTLFSASLKQIENRFEMLCNFWLYCLVGGKPDDYRAGVQCLFQRGRRDREYIFLNSRNVSQVVGQPPFLVKGQFVWFISLGRVGRAPCVLRVYLRIARHVRYISERSHTSAKGHLRKIAPDRFPR